MKRNIRLTNKQRAAIGIVRLDCGKNHYTDEKINHSRNNDNVREGSV
jgi:hypothetical protein